MHEDFQWRSSGLVIDALEPQKLDEFVGAWLICVQAVHLQAKNAYHTHHIRTVSRLDSMVRAIVFFFLNFFQQHKFEVLPQAAFKQVELAFDFNSYGIFSCVLAFQLV